MPRTARLILGVAAAVLGAIADASPVRAQPNDVGRQRASYYSSERYAPAQPASLSSAQAELSPAESSLAQTEIPGSKFKALAPYDSAPAQGKTRPISSAGAVASGEQSHGVESLPLPPPSRRTSGSIRSGQPGASSKALATVGSSLAIVLGLFFAVAWITRRSLPKSAAALPTEVIEVLGRAPLAGRQQMHLLRVGNKLVLVSITPAGAETLAEITDAVEVDRICGLCRRQRSDSVSASFRHVLEQMGAERATGGFVGNTTGRSR